MEVHIDLVAAAESDFDRTQKNVQTAAAKQIGEADGDIVEPLVEGRRQGIDDILEEIGGRPEFVADEGKRDVENLAVERVLDEIQQGD